MLTHRFTRQYVKKLWDKMKLTGSPVKKEEEDGDTLTRVFIQYHHSHSGSKAGDVNNNNNENNGDYGYGGREEQLVAKKPPQTMAKGQQDELPGRRKVSKFRPAHIDGIANQGKRREGHKEKDDDGENDDDDDDEEEEEEVVRQKPSETANVRQLGKLGNIYYRILSASDA